MKKLSGALAAGTIAIASTQALAMGAISGGGQLIEDGNKISFGVWANDVPGVSVEGEIQVNFHSTSTFSKKKFHGTMVGTPNFFPPNSETCNSAANVTFAGTFDGEPGWEVILRVGEAGPPGQATMTAFDTVRIELFDPASAKWYDTDGGDFLRQSSCVGSARTGLDRGNVTIEIAEPI